MSHPDRTVTKEEILSSLWTGVHVTENVLTHSILEIRKVLGDDPRTADYIKTIPRKGYRFIADVQTMWNLAERRPDEAAFAIAG